MAFDRFFFPFFFPHIPHPPLQDEIASKETALAKEHSAHDELEQQKVRLKGEVDRQRQAAQRQQQELLAAEGEVSEKGRRRVRERGKDRKRVAGGVGRSIFFLFIWTNFKSSSFSSSPSFLLSIFLSLPSLSLSAR